MEYGTNTLFGEAALTCSFSEQTTWQGGAVELTTGQRRNRSNDFQVVLQRKQATRYLTLINN